MRDDLECWRCGDEGAAFSLPSHPDGGGTICHDCWERMFGSKEVGGECRKSPTGKHEADPLSGSFPPESDGDEFLHFVVDYSCKHCGRSGSVRVDPAEISWD